MHFVSALVDLCIVSNRKPKRRKSMRMLILAIPFLSAATGCIIYDNDGSLGDDPNHTRPGIDADTGAEDVAPQISLTFTPPQAEQGEIFIGSLSVTDGDSDLSAVVSVTVYGDANVLAIDSRADEVLVTVAVDSDAASSNSDIVVEFEDGTAVWLEAGLSISPEGSGNSTGDYTGSTGPTEDPEDDADEDPCP
jgi:hypothetical protein